ncbi:MAG: UDP-N-acetylmuramoyl-L-alanyl-D-glutamate--2,6-diaminopimelate ligase [Rhodospirillaceae bacterium]|jgi:UDP-N-acetylmuramoyl-L-alanyl-D-glutamate--2,6-diaminopimelate ligase|nr:UDP-N-acetylmuramoyl-L-alanyl-D-glutamate--2,6-diaminopimelate ligase [Rhodospirillaceae bacterium]MBT4045327.1 UDP-N-acetylmuramoyl-L-alanyl-D-glutamate--2,6-diaminopimelate ligase [Rhodospirillaceae bacterium]MBT4690546.1 UDP-N-acetylmuramoyl-L-alanyl-D-glutamate--2,6-diaminopimelate ligase [Rhodospirillaceae bacterium]MBT5083893.1 UDP-N-acetylmuramoyl-L-alanyl-D-glutamate--2,6-diaminopimelate ligase [Rhodospirillaceae bacterium]MBT5526653.1 UDP-N-acetylmuramoyl-L-alanyl-D-glutamate--2,6-d
MGESVKQLADREIVGLTADSRSVEPGYLFAALPSSVASSPLNGANFVPEALRRGAAALLGPPGLAANLETPIDVPVIEDEDPRRRLSQLAARFFAEQPRTIVAVTGTAGKSSVADFVRQIWLAMGLSGASMGTLGINSTPLQRPLAHTTPDPVVLHEALRDLAAAGVDHLALEASSHGLEQSRLDFVKVMAAAFTNLSRDHLDYHTNEEAYLQAKLHLFKVVMGPGGTAVLPHGQDLTDRLRAACQARAHNIWTFGAGGDIDLRQREIFGTGQRLTIAAQGFEATLDLPLIGAFQADNVLCAISLVLACGEGPEDVFTAAAQLTGVPGRLQAVGGHVYVDYAHKPEALRAAIDALRPHTKGQLVVVFGCGGDRDKGKRPIMGAIADQLADQIIVTDDNPRSEDPSLIRAEILSACPGAVEIGDRGLAIATAISGLAADDVLLIAGKGHETGQTVAGVTHPFDDRDVARKILAEVRS